MEFQVNVSLTKSCKKKKHFLDSEEITHYITWKSPDFDFFIDMIEEKNRKVDSKIGGLIIGKRNQGQNQPKILNQFL